MALPSGTISSAFAGLLKVSLTAEIIWNDKTYPYTGPGGEMVLRAWINDGTSIIYLPMINKTANSASKVISYPGGGAVWTIGVEKMFHSFSGGGIISATNIQLAAELRKR